MLNCLIFFHPFVHRIRVFCTYNIPTTRLKCPLLIYAVSPISFRCTTEVMVTTNMWPGTKGPEDTWWLARPTDSFTLKLPRYSEISSWYLCMRLSCAEGSFQKISSDDVVIVLLVLLKITLRFDSTVRLMLYILIHSVWFYSKIYSLHFYFSCFTVVLLFIGHNKIRISANFCSNI